MSSLHANVAGLIRIGIALLLSASAVAKLLAPQILADGGFGFSLAHQAIPIVELAVAAWTLCGLFPSACHLACVVLFSAFGGYSLSIVVWSEGSCGCFGRLQVSPLLVLGIDAAVLASLAIVSGGCTNSGWTILSLKKSSDVVVCGCRISLLIGATFLTSFGLANAFRWYSPETTVELTTRSLLAAKGRILPFHRCLDTDQSVLVGHWLLVIHRSDCQRCQAKLLSSRPDIARILHNDDRLRLGVIDVAEDPGTQLELLHECDSRSIPWTQTCVARPSSTPILVLTSNGYVVDVLPEQLPGESHLANE